MAWVTGYDGWSFYVHQGVLLGLEGEPVWWGRGMDGLGAKRTVFMKNENIVGYPDHFVQSTERHPMQHLAREIEKRGWAKGAIGVELDNYWYSAAAHGTLQKELPNLRFVDTTGLVNWQRSVKSDAEIDFIRRAARIVDAMHALVVDLVEPGLAKNVLVAEIQKQAILGADGNWGDYCGHRADAAVRPRCHGAASHLGRPAVPRRARGRSSSLAAAIGAITARCRARSISASRRKNSSRRKRR